MVALRWILLALCLVTPAVSYRIGGPGLWLAHGLGCVAAALVAVWILRDDGILRAAFEYKAGDPTLAMLSAMLLFVGVTAGVRYVLAPEELLRICGSRGAWVPRPDAHGLTAATEWLRDQACQAFYRSAGLRGPARAAGVVVLAAAEEVAWRGGVQQVLSERLGSARGWLAASALFALAHLGTGNAAVALLALAGGLVWGGLYLWRGRLLPAVVSHVAFSFALFFNNIPFAIRFDTLH